MKIQLITVPYRYDEHREGAGLGPEALLAAGLAERLGAAGHDLLAPLVAHLDPAAREPGRTALNIGKLGADTARLVAAARRAGVAALVAVGDDTAAVGVVAGLQAAEGIDAPIGIVWLDAHGDFNTPESSYSGILAGMPLAIIAGLAGRHWRDAAGLAEPIATERILIAGTRDLDEQEEAIIRSTAVRLVDAGELKPDGHFREQLDRLAAASSVLFVHVDLDVLDPRLVPSCSTPVANGLEVAEAAAAIDAVLRTGKVAVVSISSLNPGGGTRGEQSIASTLALVEQALAGWQAIPPPSAPEAAS